MQDSFTARPDDRERRASGSTTRPTSPTRPTSRAIAVLRRRRPTPASTTASPTPGAPFNQLPGAEFPGADAGVCVQELVAPRRAYLRPAAATAATSLKFNYARYVGQLGTGDMSSTYNTGRARRSCGIRGSTSTATSSSRPNEIVLTPAPLSWTGGYNYINPTPDDAPPARSTPNLSADNTDEIIVSFDKQIGNEFAVSASYIWRKYPNFRGNDYDNFDAEQLDGRVSWTPPAATCPAGASCPAVTYYQPTSQLPDQLHLHERQGLLARLPGVRAHGAQAVLERWQMNGSYSYNDAPVHFESPDWLHLVVVDERPDQHRERLNGGQYAPESTSSGLGNVFVNATWIARVSGLYMLPLVGHQPGGLLQHAQRLPVHPLRPDAFNRPFSAGQATVFLDKRGDERLPNFQTMDFRVDKMFTLLQPRRSSSPAWTSSTCSTATPRCRCAAARTRPTPTRSARCWRPRVLRFGVRATW